MVSLVLIGLVAGLPSVILDSLTLEIGTVLLSRNAGKKLPLLVANNQEYLGSYESRCIYCAPPPPKKKILSVLFSHAKILWA